MENCFHCGDICESDHIHLNDKYFCCHGCKTVFEILHEHDLTQYYQLEDSPGITPTRFEGKYDFLKDPAIAAQLLEFDEQDHQIIQLLIPSMHCISCIWVLEHLGKLHAGVRSAHVNFPEKTVRIQFNPNELTVFELVKLLSQLGYAPYISMEDGASKTKKHNRQLIYQLGVAGFAFGNIMFLSFPEYFEVNEFWLERYKHVFRWLMFAFSVPVVFYSGRRYFESAIKGLLARRVTIDVPIALGISVLFIRSTIDISLDLGTGFFDSLAGLIFFLLLGKFFQEKTYAYLSFERDYKSYFPLAVTQLVKNAPTESSSATISEKQTQVRELQPGDRILIRHGELIPVDAVLIKGTALIDYSFVTGEAQAVEKQSGDKLFAGGRQQGATLELEVVQAVEQSYLTQLWSNEIFNKKSATTFYSLTDRLSKRFTIIILSIAFLSLGFWWWWDATQALNVFTAVLIIACPCAIALAAPFTLGNLLRYFGKAKCYLKNTETIERMSQLDTLVFDKTGTLSSHAKSDITYHGSALSQSEQNLLNNTLRASNHPLSRALYSWLQTNDIYTLDDFTENIGQGISGSKDTQRIHAGSLNYVQQSGGLAQGVLPKPQTSQVHIATDEDYKGYYSFRSAYRDGLVESFDQLASRYHLVVLSGDNDSEQEMLASLLPVKTTFHFNQKPQDKLEFIKKLQQQGRKVLMIGDGLNDAGALAQSDVGMAISEDINVFTPACDGILDAEQFQKLPQFLSLAQRANTVIKYAFLFSLCYNLIGLTFAVTGHLRPVVAAVLMPLSSISIMVLTTLWTYFISKPIIKNNPT